MSEVNLSHDTLRLPCGHACFGVRKLFLHLAGVTMEVLKEKGTPPVSPHTHFYSKIAACHGEVIVVETEWFNYTGKMVCYTDRPDSLPLARPITWLGWRWFVKV